MENDYPEPKPEQLPYVAPCEGKKRLNQTHQVPPSQLLNQLANFLPEIAHANKKLEEIDVGTTIDANMDVNQTSDSDEEIISTQESTQIEMNLYCGILAQNEDTQDPIQRLLNPSSTSDTPKVTELP